MIKVSKAFPPLTVSVIVRVAELLTATDAAVILRPDVKVMFGTADVLNANPAGVFRISVTPVPAVKSELAPSFMEMGPRVVHAGEVALAAVSAKMFVPPVALVIVTVAHARPPSTSAHARTIVPRRSRGFNIQFRAPL